MISTPTGPSEGFSRRVGFPEDVIDRPLERVKSVFSPADGFSLAVVHSDERGPADRHDAIIVRAMFFNDARPRRIECILRNDTYPDAVGKVLSCVPIKPVVGYFPDCHDSSIKLSR